MTNKIEKIIRELYKEVQKEYPGTITTKVCVNLGYVKMEIEKSKPFTHITIEKYLEKAGDADA